MTSRNISIRSLANQLGLSSSTVSRALNGHTSIHPETIARVEKAAKAAGYRPNPDVKIAMASVRRATGNSVHGILGVLNFHPVKKGLQDELFKGALYQGIRNRADQLGWAADEIRVKEKGMNARRLSSILNAKNIQGVILLPPPLHDLEMPVNLKGLQVVLSSAAWENCTPLVEEPSVLPAHWRNSLMLFQHLKDAGYKRPMLLIHDSIESRHMHATEAAFLLTQHQKHWDKNLKIHHGALTKDGIGKRICKEKPDVIVGPGVFVKTFLEKDLGMNVPGDITFQAYASTHPEIAGLDQRWDAIGESTVDLLSSMIIHRRSERIRASGNLLVQGRLIPGPTLPIRSQHLSTNGES